MIILLILATAVVVGIVQGIIEIIRNPVIIRYNDIENPDNINVLDKQKNELENKLELIAAQIDTLHELIKSIDLQLDGYHNEKQRTTLLNKKVITISKLEQLQDKQNKIINLLDDPWNMRSSFFYLFLFSHEKTVKKQRNTKSDLLAILYTMIY